MRLLENTLQDGWAFSGKSRLLSVGVASVEEIERSDKLEVVASSFVARSVEKLEGDGDNPLLGCS